MSSTLYKIFPSTIHTFRKPYSSLAAFNLRIRNFVKLSVMERFLPFNFFLLLKTLHLSEHLAKLTIMGQHLFSDFASIWWVWSIAFTSRSISISDLIVWITTSSVTFHQCLLSLMSCIRRQFLLEYYSSLVLLLYVCLLLCFTIFVFRKGHTLLQTCDLLIFLFSLFLVLIKLFHNIINWTCQIF